MKKEELEVCFRSLNDVIPHIGFVKAGSVIHIEQGIGHKCECDEYFFCINRNHIIYYKSDKISFGDFLKEVVDFINLRIDNSRIDYPSKQEVDEIAAMFKIDIPKSNVWFGGTKEILTNDIKDFVRNVAETIVKNHSTNFFTNGNFTISVYQVDGCRLSCKVDKETGDIVIETPKSPNKFVLEFSIMFSILRRSMSDNVSTDKRVLELLPDDIKQRSFYAREFASHLTNFTSVDNSERIRNLLDKLILY